MNQVINRPRPDADGCGRLPSAAPLANPYVPFQQASAERYQAKKGLIRGTLYPGLDLPFMGMVNKTEKSDTPLHELQALSFAMVELGQYLDTHKEDAEAAALFREYAEAYERSVAQYEQTCGPLYQKDAVCSGSYQWLNDPWPWDQEKTMQREV